MPVVREPVQLDLDYIQDPHAVATLLRAEAPVRPAILPRGLRVWLVTSYTDAKALLADQRLSKDARRAGELFERHTTATGGAAGGFSQDLAAHMLNSDPPDHTRLRKLVNKAFTGRTVARLRPRIEQLTTDLLDAMQDNEDVDLLDEFAFPLPITVICELLGGARGSRALPGMVERPCLGGVHGADRAGIECDGDLPRRAGDQQAR